MALLDYVDPETADDRTRDLLAADADYYGQPSLFARALANNPDVFAARSEYHRRLVAEGDLPERLCELVYLTVSVTNDCAYCVASHREQLVERVGIPAEEVRTLAAGDQDWLDDRERAAVAVAEQVARDPATVDEAHLEALTGAGFDDADAVRLLVVAAAAVAANAIADALGISPADREESFVGG